MEGLGFCGRCIGDGKWQPSKKNPIDLEETLEGYIGQLAKDFMVREVRYDPYQAHRSAMTLAKEGLKMVEFPQTQDRLTSMSQNLYDLIKGGNLVLYRDKDFRQHAEKATAKETQRGWRTIKKKSSHRIGLIIALALAAYGCAQSRTTSGDRPRVLLSGNRSQMFTPLNKLPLFDPKKWRWSLRDK